MDKKNIIILSSVCLVCIVAIVISASILFNKPSDVNNSGDVLGVQDFISGEASRRIFYR